MTRVVRQAPRLAIDPPATIQGYGAACCRYAAPP
jgi:hypothetical protein